MLTQLINKINVYVLTCNRPNAPLRDVRLLENLRNSVLFDNVNISYFYNRYKVHGHISSALIQGFDDMLDHCFSNPNVMYALFLENDAVAHQCKELFVNQIMQLPWDAEVVLMGGIGKIDWKARLVNNNIVRCYSSSSPGFQAAIFTRLGYEKYTKTRKTGQAAADLYFRFQDHKHELYYTIPCIFGQNVGKSDRNKVERHHITNLNTGKIISILLNKELVDHYNSVRKANGNKYPNYIN